VSSGDWSGEIAADTTVGGRSRDHVLLAVAALLVGVAYRGLIAPDFRTGLLALESWFIRPTGLPFPVALCGALWLLCRRSGRWRALPDDGSGRWLAATALLASALLLAWGRLTGVVDLQVLSLAALAVGWAALSRGRAGARLVALPALFLLLALSPSPAAVNEIFWFIQVHTAWAAAAVVDGFGLPVLLQTIVLTTPEQIFGVIESCASLGVIVILLALALLIRERITQLGGRSWLLVLSAVPLAIALNLVRVVTIVIQPSLNAWSHLVQWGVLLGCGALVLAGVARVLARRAPPGQVSTGGGSSPTIRVRPGAFLALAALILLSLLPRPSPSPPPLEPSVDAIPLEHAGWTAEDLWVDRGFLGWVRFREATARFYRRDDQVVHLFVGIDDSRARTASPFSSKTLLPGFGWVEVGGEGAGPAMEDAPPETAIVALETERWWVAQWRLGYHGILGEAFRHALAIDASPFAEPRTRAVVRLSVPIEEGGGDVVAAAAATAERFLQDFEPFLPLPSDGSPAPHPDAR